METDQKVQRVNEEGQATQAAVLTDGFSRLAKDVAWAEVSQDTCVHIQFNDHHCQEGHVVIIRATMSYEYSIADCNGSIPKPSIHTTQR